MAILRFRFRFGLRFLQILDGQFELFDKQLGALGRLAKRLAPRLRQHQFEALDFQLADGEFVARHRQRRLFPFQQGALREDHRVCAGEVGGERFRERRHMQRESCFASKVEQNKAISTHCVMPSRSASHLWTPCLQRHAPIDSGEQIRQLRDADRDRAVRHRRPDEPSPLQPFREQARALAIVPNDLDQVAAASAENVEIAGVRVALQCLLNQKRKASKTLALMCCST